MANGDEWLTLNQAAELSGYHVNHIRRLIWKGEVDARKFGPVWAVNRQSLVAYLKEMQERGEKRGPKPEK
jgi:excisionase family DNA binding protein